MNEFQQVIKAYLDQRAQEDAQFAANYAKKGKSIEKCNNNAKTILAARQP